MANEKFIYYCGYCKKEFTRELATDRGLINEGQQVKCDISHFIPTMDFVRRAKKKDEE